MDVLCLFADQHIAELRRAHSITGLVDLGSRLHSLKSLSGKNIRCSTACCDPHPFLSFLHIFIYFFAYLSTCCLLLCPQPDQKQYQPRRAKRMTCNAARFVHIMVAYMHVHAVMRIFYGPGSLSFLAFGAWTCKC